MSLSELTRNAFQSGVSATKWLSLCKLFISKNISHAPPGAVQLELSNSVLVLYRSYPGDPNLQQYLRAAIRDGILPLSSFVTAFLAGVRSPESHHSATLDSLCRVILESHYSSGMSPVGSIVSFASPTLDILETVQDAMALLRTAHSLPLSNSQHLIDSTSELLVLLLSSISDVSHISTAQALVYFADANEMLQLRLSADVRQVLEAFVLSLSLLLGDDAKAAREAQMMHTLQLALGKGDVIGPNSETDVTSCSLFLHSLVLRRGDDYGSGDAHHVTAGLVALLRWSSWSPTVFYTQLLLAAATCLSQCEGKSPSEKSSGPLWRAFVIGRLPHVLSAFEKSVEQDGAAVPDWRTAMHFAVSTLIHRQDLIQRCDAVYCGVAATTGSGVKSPFIGTLLRQFLAVGLIEQSFATSVNSNHQHEPSKMQNECQDSGLDLQSFIESKITTDNQLDDVTTFLDKVWKDPPSHHVFAELILKRFRTAVSSSDIDALGHLCRVLYSVESALDVLSLHVKLSELLVAALTLVEDYDCETVGDPQTAVAHFGDVVLFLQHALARFHLSSMTFLSGDRNLRPDILSAGKVAYRMDSRGDDAHVFNAWFKALFDSNSEGIEDTILRSTRPKVLLRMAGTLFSHAIQLCTERRLDKEVMHNGLSYFLAPLLKWTLVGVVRVLLTEIEQRFMRVPLYLEVLQTVLTSSSCPRPVTQLTAGSILRLFNSSSPSAFDPSKLRKVALEALKLPTHVPTVGTSDWVDGPRRHIQEALATARSGKAAYLDVDQCLLYTTPTRFLQTMWAELTTAISVGELETPRRIATFILSQPRSASSPPLLPLFFHVVLPSTISALDQAPPAEQTMAIELLVAVISSTLTAALQLEWALLLVCNEPRFVLGQSISAMVRRLGGDLRRSSGSHISTVIVQRLSSSQSFATNFPSFTADN